MSLTASASWVAMPPPLVNWEELEAILTLSSEGGSPEMGSSALLLQPALAHSTSPGWKLFFGSISLLHTHEPEKQMSSSGLTDLD